MMFFRLPRLAISVVVVLAGCAELPPVLPSPEPKPTLLIPPPALPSAADDVMDLLGRIGRASPADLVREYESLASIPDENRAGTSQLSLALLLSQPGLPFRDDAAALRVLQQWEKSQPAADPAQKSFVHWLRAMLVERNRLAGSLEDAGSRLREERKRAEACKEKLEALKNMEKSLIERDKH